MMRMLLEVVMVLALVGGLLFVTKVLAKENRSDKSLPRIDDGDKNEGPAEPEAKKD